MPQPSACESNLHPLTHLGSNGHVIRLRAMVAIVRTGSQRARARALAPAELQRREGR